MRNAARFNESVPDAVRLAREDVAAIEDVAAKFDMPMASLLRGCIRTALAVTRDESVGIASIDSPRRTAPS